MVLTLNTNCLQKFSFCFYHFMQCDLLKVCIYIFNIWIQRYSPEAVICIKTKPPIHLHLVFEISSSKNIVRQTGFFLSISNQIFAGYTGSKNLVRNRQKNPVLDFSNQSFQKSSGDGQGDRFILCLRTQNGICT